jgi:hypothetical protein
MTIRMFKKSLRVPGLMGVSEDHELELGKYNEFYLPSVDRDHELWVVVTDDSGVVTKLHLKR